MHRWLILLIITFITVIVFIFFFLHLQPVWTPDKDKAEETPVATISAPTITFVDPKKGAGEPQAIIVVFGDFQCQPCKELATNLDVVLRTEPKIQVVWKDMPNESLHELAVSAAVAAHCAGSQGKFWEYHDQLFDNQIVINENIFEQIAQTIGLDVEKYQKCFANQETLPLVRKNYEEGLALQITATPIIFIGQERLVGIPTVEEILTLARKSMTASSNSGAE